MHPDPCLIRATSGAPLTELSWWPAAMHQSCIELEKVLVACGADHPAERAFWEVSRRLNAWCIEMNSRSNWVNADMWYRWATVWEGSRKAAVDGTAGAPTNREVEA